MALDDESMITVDESTESAAPATKTPQGEPGPQRSLAGMALVILSAAAAVLGALVYSGIHSRVEAETNLKVMTEQAAIPTVNVIYPKAGASTQEIVLPGNTQAFTDTPIYARTSGYLTRWYFDIGAHVKKGQSLAEIATPEIDQQLQQARADLATARANLQLARITATRWQNLWKTNSVGSSL